MTPAEADAYFAQPRPRLPDRRQCLRSNRARWPASRSSIDAVDALKASLGEDQPVPRPDHWCGTRIIPLELEFWKDGAFRLHDRVRFSRPDAAAPWTRQRLYP